MKANAIVIAHSESAAEKLSFGLKDPRFEKINRGWFGCENIPRDSHAVVVFAKSQEDFNNLKPIME